MKTLDEVNEIALEIGELVNSQLGLENNYLTGVSIIRSDSALHFIPKNYSEKYYICVEGADDMKRPDKLKLPKYHEGIYITEEQSGRPEFAVK